MCAPAPLGGRGGGFCALWAVHTYFTALVCTQSPAPFDCRLWVVRDLFFIVSTMHQTRRHTCLNQNCSVVCRRNLQRRFCKGLFYIPRASTASTAAAVLFLLLLLLFLLLLVPLMPPLTTTTYGSAIYYVSNCGG